MRAVLAAAAVIRAITTRAEDALDDVQLAVCTVLFGGGLGRRLLLKLLLLEACGAGQVVDGAGSDAVYLLLMRRRLVLLEERALRGIAKAL